MSAPLGQGDQIVVHGGVAREHDRAVRGVETVRKSRNRVAVRHGDGGDPDNPIVENDDRNLGEGPGPFRNMDVDSPDKRARVRHAGVQRHDVQMVGVAGQDVLDQVRCAGGRQFRVDRGLTMEGGIACWQRFGPRRPVDADRRERAVIADAAAPRVKEHAGQITGVVGMKVGQEHGLQAGEVESRVGEGGRRPATAVDDEDSFADDEC